MGRPAVERGAEVKDGEAGQPEGQNGHEDADEREYDSMYPQHRHTSDRVRCGLAVVSPSDTGYKNIPHDAFTSSRRECDSRLLLR